MEKVSTRKVAMVALVLLLGLVLAGQEASVAEASAKADCEVSGDCDRKLTVTFAGDPTRPGALANKYTRGCSKINQCRD